MSFGQIIVCSVVLLAMAIVFLFLEKNIEIGLGKSYFLKRFLKKNAKKIENIMNYIKKTSEKS